VVILVVSTCPGDGTSRSNSPTYWVSLEGMIDDQTQSSRAQRYGMGNRQDCVSGCVTTWQETYGVEAELLTIASLAMFIELR
jgi:hypothetical protein